MMNTRVGTRRTIPLLVIAIAAGLALLPGGGAASAQQVVAGGMHWMNAFPATWNAAAPKVAFDGLHTYAVVCGLDGSQDICSIARQRDRENWTRDGYRFRSHQPAVMILDRKGRLNVFYNDPSLHHIRFDHPAIDLHDVVDVPLGVTAPVGYLHASYDAATDSILLAANETTTWTTYFSIKHGAGEWTPPAALPRPDATGSMYLYARTLFARGRYYVLAGEHPRAASNASYTAAVLFESANPTGPWSARVLHRATGANVGIPYQNWVVATDLQADPAGRVRALLHIVETGSGHAALAEGFHLAREEDGYALHHVAGGIDDGFALVVDDSGAHAAIGLRLSDPRYAEAGRLVAFRSDDGGLTWHPPARLTDESALNPVPVDARNGSLTPVRELPFIYSAPLSPPFERVMSSAVPLGLADTSDRFQEVAIAADGTETVVRVYRHAPSDRAYRYERRRRTDGYVALTFTYTAGAYSSVYVADSAGNFRYSDSEGYVRSGVR